MQPTLDSFTPISEVGEFGLIDRMRRVLGPLADPDVLCGIGDDAAVMRLDEKRAQVITTDALIEGIHFDRVFMPMHYLGFKALAVNVSDIVAMNARPRYATLALGLPNNVSVEMVETLYQGLRQAAERYGVTLIGGDTTASRAMVVSVTVIGEAATEQVVYRSGARPGDLLCVTGDLGSAYAGLKVLLRQKEVFESSDASLQPNLEPYTYVVQRQLMPQARQDVIDRCAELEIVPHAMIDVSDGLASEVHHLCRASGCGAEVEVGNIPVHRQTNQVAEEFGEDVGTYTLFGGEDYQLLMALPEDDLKRLDQKVFTVIGRFDEVEAGIRAVAPNGETIRLEPRGFTHF